MHKKDDIKILQKMLRQGLTLQIMHYTEHCQKEKMRKVNELMKYELCENIMKNFTGLRAKTHSYLIDDHSEDRKAKGTKMCAIKRKLKFEDYKNCLEATELENKINHLENNELM